MKNDTDGVVLPTGEVCRRHTNGGGLVEVSASVAASVYIGPDARVLGHAQVVDGVRIAGRAIVQDCARLRGDVYVGGDARVGGSAVVQDCVWILDQSTVCGMAYLAGDVVVCGETNICDAFLDGTEVVGGTLTEAHIHEATLSRG